MGNKIYSAKDELNNIKVAEFMRDLDVALGHDYERPGHLVFPEFSPQYHSIDRDDSLLFERLARAYQELENARKRDALNVVHKALALCARSPQGLRRSLVCVDLAHAIDPAFGSEELYSSLLLRPTDRDELAEWVWQLVRRWRKWNVKVISTPDHWKKAIRIVAPKGILEVLSYFHEQIAGDNIQSWYDLRRIAFERIDQEEDALHERGHDPDILRERILSQMTPSTDYGQQCVKSSLNDTSDKEHSELVKTLPPRLRNSDRATLISEIEWLARESQDVQYG